MHNPHLRHWFAGALVLLRCLPFTTATYCRLKTQASCIGDIRQFTDIGQVRTNPFEHNNNLPFYKSKKKFKVGFADLDNDGDEDLVVGRADVTGIVYFENTATFGTQATFEDRLNNPERDQPVNGPFTRLATATNHWAPEQVSQAVFYDMDNDGDMDMVLGGKKGTARYYENVGTVDKGDFMPWDGTSTGASYKSTSGKNWDFDPFKDVVQTDPCILINGACQPNWSFTITITDFSGANSKAAGVAVTQASNTATGVMTISLSTSTETTIQVTASDFYQVFDLAADLIIDGMTIPQSNLVAVTRERSGKEESSIAIYDIDRDGDGDVILGESAFRASGLSFFENVGNAAVAQFVKRIEPARNPFYGISVATYMKPFVFDFDNDGDGDLLIGHHDRYINYYENTGSATNPAFTEIVDSNRHPTSSTVTDTEIGPDNQPTIFLARQKTWTFVITSQSILEREGTDVTQTSSSGSGLLAVELTGSGMISITVTSAVGQIFDTAADLVIGRSTIPHTSVISVSSVITAKEHLVVGALNTIRFFEGGVPATPIFTPRIGTGANPFDDLSAQAAAAAPTVTFLSAVAALGDLDDDGDVDLILGTEKAVLYHFRNVGNRQVAKFSLVAGTSKDSGNLCYGLLDYSAAPQYAAPNLYDINGDGLLDLLVALRGARVVYGKNTGTTTTPAFTLVTGVSSPFEKANGNSVFDTNNFQYLNLAPFHDWMDNGRDELADLVAGDEDGFVSMLRRGSDRFEPHYYNSGTAGPVWSGNSAVRAPAGSGGSSRYSAPTFNDVNKDGLVDLVLGNQRGGVVYWKNTGSAGSLNSVFTEQTGSDDPFASINIGEYAAPLFYDMDDDGDDDLIIGGANGKLNYFERMGCVPEVICNNRGSCATNAVNGLLPVCKCSTEDAVGPQCEFCAPGFVESKKIGAQSLGAQTGLVCNACVAGFWSGTVSFGVSVAESASAAAAAAESIPSACTQCMSGRFGVTFTATSVASCAECPVGFVDSKSTSGIVARTSCDPCLPGSVQPAPATFAGCDDCVVGKVQQNKAQTACADCNSGRFMDQTGQTTCLDCLPGTKMAATTGAQTSCDDCSLGQVQPDKRQIKCLACDPGEYQNVDGKTACLPCIPVRDFFFVLF